MAEFTSAMHEWARMCNAHTDNCQSCPLNGNPFCEKEIFDLTPSVIKKAEQIIMAWAEEHPEPVYETWYEWLKDNGLTFHDAESSWIGFTERIHHPIPADIAEKLGIEPKEG